MRHKMENLSKKIKASKYFLLIIPFSAAFLLSYCGANKGTVTIVNATLKPVNVILDGKDIALESEKHFTQKGLKPGKHKVNIGTEVAMEIDVSKSKTTVVDVGGDNCFAVTDYSAQYDEKSDGKVKVVEKFVNKKVFTTSVELTSDLGEYLPEAIHHDKNITRLHKVDCSWIDNDQAIIDAVANLP